MEEDGEGRSRTVQNGVMVLDGEGWGDGVERCGTEDDGEGRSGTVRSGTEEKRRVRREL